MPGTFPQNREECHQNIHGTNPCPTATRPTPQPGKVSLHPLQKQEKRKTPPPLPFPSPCSDVYKTEGDQVLKEVMFVALCPDQAFQQSGSRQKV